MKKDVSRLESCASHGVGAMGQDESETIENFDIFTIACKLDSGSHAEVYKAIKSGGNRQALALKVFAPKDNRDYHKPRVLEREFNIVKAER